MNIAFFYESVLPTRGGCETYINDLARRLIHDGHDVHLYARRWDEKALPRGITYHRVRRIGGLRFMRPWRFARRCLRAAQGQPHDITMGFDKTWGQDVLYPQGGLHIATAEHNLRKFSSKFVRGLAWFGKWFDLAHWSYTLLERKQYFTPPTPVIVVNSYMVQRHFEAYYGVPAEQLRMVRSAIDPSRFPEHDRLKQRQDFRSKLDIAPDESVALMAAMNYRLKGLDPLLLAVQHLVNDPVFHGRKPRFRLLVVGNPKVARYQRQARRLGISEFVTFAGHCPEMRHAYFASDFLVHPTFYDPCSLVVLEALACGLPVITTKYNGASELLRPLQEGYVVEDPHDAGRLAWAMLQMLDPARRQMCSQAARRTAGTWTFEHHYRQLLDVFQEVVRGKQAA